MDRGKVWVLSAACWLGACATVTPSAAPLSSEPSREAAPVDAAVSPANPQVEKPAPGSNKKGRQALYQRACDLGSAIGCNDLAILRIDEPARAMPLLERACSLGLTRGCANLGVQLLKENEQRERALELLNSSCEQTDGFACAELGDALYGDGEASSPLAKAHSAYEKACTLGVIDACANAGWMFRNGDGTPKNAARARELFRFACEKASFSGCAALGYDLISDAKNGDEVAEGSRWLKVACENEHAFGCFALGGALLSSGQGPTPAVHALFKRSCSLGLKEGCEHAAWAEEQLKEGAAAPPAAEAEEPE